MTPDQLCVSPARRLRGANSSRRPPNSERRAHRRPTTLRPHAGAEQRRDGAGWLRPASAHALPTLAGDTSIQPAIRAASDVRGVRSRRGHQDDLRLLGIDRHCAGSPPPNRRWASATSRRYRHFRNIRRQRRRAGCRESCGGWRARACPTAHPERGRATCGRHQSWTRARRPRSRPRVVPARAGGTRSSARDESPVAAERTIPMMKTGSPICMSAPRSSQRLQSATLRSVLCLPRLRPALPGSL
jgi:hypothetical protein